MEPKKEDINYYSDHFRKRLQERYGIEITNEEFLHYSTLPIDLIYSISPNKRFGTIVIKDQEVFVVKCNAAKILNTCFPPNGAMPMPLRYKRLGLTAEDFNSDFIKAMHKISKLEKWLTNHYKTDDDKKDFFVNMPYKYKDWMYGAAWSRFNGRTKHWTVKIVKNLCYPHGRKRQRQRK